MRKFFNLIFSSKQRGFYIKLFSTLFILFSVRTTVNAFRFNCPSNSLIRPCVCQEKRSGFDFVCEGATLDQLKEAFDSISQNGGQIVYYLKILNSTNLKLMPNYLLDGIRISHLISHYNNLEEVEQDAFITTINNQLLSIDLSFNQLKKVPSNSFRTLSSLISLNLNYNQIEYINEFAFVGLVSLLRLSLFGNRIKQIDANSFTGIGGNLTRINLGGNLLEHVPSHCLKSLQTLNRLHLHENKITTLESGLFTDFIASDTLDTLVLNKNQIQVIPDKAFKYLVGLNSLEIVNNKISSIQYDAFYQIEDSLEWIKLSENHLADIPSKALKNLTRLRLLDIRSNNISQIGKNAFFNFGKSLKFLHLQNNRIIVIEDGAFDDLHSLEWLYLSSNRLFTLSATLFNPIISAQRLRVLDIHGNPFICNCELSWLSELIIKEESIVNLPKQTRCKLNIRNALEHLDQDNQVQFISDLENFSRKLNSSLNNVKIFHQNYLNQMAVKRKSTTSQVSNNKEDIPLGEMNRCSSSQSVNYKYHLYCLVLSFIVVHLIYYYLGYLFP